MSDLSQPPAAALAALAAPHIEQERRAAEAAAAGPFVWPTPDVAGFAAPQPWTRAPACSLEGLNGHLIEGHLASFDPHAGALQVRLPGQRKPLLLRFDQFRRLQLAEPLRPEAAGLGDWPRLPFRLTFRTAHHWDGHSLGVQERDSGYFLFEPLDEHGTVRRWFVPRAALSGAQLGVPVGQALVEQDSATPEQIQAALAEQEALRERRLGDLLVVRQIITPEELAEAIDQQARMPMVRIGQALTALGFISEAQLEDALVQQREDRGVPLGELLVRKGMVSRADLQTALARKMGYPLVDVMQYPPDAEAVSRLPYALAARVPALPLMVRAGRLVVAVEDPSNRQKLDELEFAAQCKLVPVLARSNVLLGAVDRAYEKVGAAEFTPRAAEPGAPLEFDAPDARGLLASMERVEAHYDEHDDAPLEQSDNTLVRLINSMILEAHNQGVSDIHIECPPGREKVRIRFRKDGVLRPYLELPPSHRSALIGRLKIMCDLDISERRKPQDGKINFAKFVPGVRLELRVATIPTQGNLEDAVLRLLASSKPLPLEALGLAPANLKRLREAAERPYGLILCVGPTGSGKTTTLHSLLASINTPERKIWTAEDPVEISQAGLRQVQVNPRIDWTFAKALRAFLRADPDVIMVGEVRDEETAQVAIEASLTGHLVLSTLHTNSAPETVTRLLDMGMDPFNFADALLAVLAQRLVRKLCSHCRTQRDATPEETEELLHDWQHVTQGVDGAPTADAVLAGWRERFGQGGRLRHFHAPGCDHCGGTGFRGRIAIHELMTVDRGLRHMVQTGQRADELQRQALAAGMRTLRQDGIEKVLAGVTAIGEVRANS